MNDATALVVLKYSEMYGRWVFVVHAWRRVGLAPSEAADLIAKAISDYDPDTVVADTGGIGLAFVQEFNRRYPRLDGRIQAAKKADKRTRLEMMSDALNEADLAKRRGLFIVDGNGTGDLQNELATLQWDEGREDIAEGQDDDLANAAQYGFGEVPSYENRIDAEPEKTREQEDHERAHRGDDDDRPDERAYNEESDL